MNSARKYLLMTIPYHTIHYPSIPQQPHRTLPNHTISYHTIHYPTIPYHTTPYITQPYNTTPYITLPYYTIPHRTLPNHTIPHLSKKNSESASIYLSQISSIAVGLQEGNHQPGFYATLCQYKFVCTMRLYALRLGTLGSRGGGRAWTEGTGPGCATAPGSMMVSRQRQNIPGPKKQLEPVRSFLFEPIHEEYMFGVLSFEHQKPCVKVEGEKCHS